MTQEEFIKVLNREKYSYKMEGDRIVVTYKGNVYLRSLTSLPPSVTFKNKGPVHLGEGDVHLDSLTSLPHGVVFRNGGDVNLNSLSSILPDVEFRNEGGVDLNNIYSLPLGLEFNHGGFVSLESITGSGYEYGFPEFYIEGIHPNRILNAMIKQGIFER